MSKHVTIYYGPYEAFFTLSYKPQKLGGLQDSLLKSGYTVDLVPACYYNYCVIKIMNIEVFRCDIRHLSYNTPPELDPICKEALTAINSCSKKIQRARDYFWLRNVLYELIQQKQFDPRKIVVYKSKLPSKCRCKCSCPVPLELKNTK